jgi:hypothetical protein
MIVFLWPIIEKILAGMSSEEQEKLKKVASKVIAEKLTEA